MWPRGFYAILDRDDEPLCRVLARHASVLQVRVKPAPVAEVERIARMARRVCSEAGIPLVVNDRVDLALAVGADGVHLGQGDLPIQAARAIAGDRLAIGLSTHDLAQVDAAIAARPAYIAYGPVFATTTKENPDPVQGLAALRAAVQRIRGSGLPSPVVAIGGISPQTADEVFAAGPDAVCVIHAVNNASDVANAALALHNSYARLGGEGR